MDHDNIDVITHDVIFPGDIEESSITLCDKHAYFARAEGVKYLGVSHGLHWGKCDKCEEEDV